MLSRSTIYNNYECFYIALTVEIQYEPKIKKTCLDGTLKIAFFTKNLYISDVYHMFLNRRDYKAYKNHLKFDFYEN